MAFNTGNPVPSNSGEDLDDNAKALDSAVSGEALTFLDRLGKTRKTWKNIESEAASAISSASASASSASSSAAAAKGYKDQASQVSGLDTVDDAIKQAPALIDGLRRSVEAASGGKMSVFYTAKNQPSYFVRIPKFNCEDAAPGGEIGTGVLESFKFGDDYDAEIWVGAYTGAKLATWRHVFAVELWDARKITGLVFRGVENGHLAAACGFD